jgi:alpha-1,3-rhamnosyl/mannosyltransferase
MTPRGFMSRTKALFWASIQSLRWSDIVVTDSDHTRLDLLKTRLVSPRRVVTVYPGILNRPAAEPSSVGDELRPYVLYVGSHKPNKNLERLVVAFSRLRRPGQLRLVIAGWDEDRYVDKTLRAIRACAIRDRVAVLHGGLSGRDMSSLYRKSDAFIHPSTYEGFGSPLVEAMAHGVPCACSASSSLSEISGDAALHFDPTSVTDISQKLNRLLDDRSLRDHLSTAGPKRAAMFSWPVSARSMAAVIESATCRRWQTGNAEPCE